MGIGSKSHWQYLYDRLGWALERAQAQTCGRTGIVASAVARDAVFPPFDSADTRWRVPIGVTCPMFVLCTLIVRGSYGRVWPLRSLRRASTYGDLIAVPRCVPLSP